MPLGANQTQTAGVCRVSTSFSRETNAILQSLSLIHPLTPTHSITHTHSHTHIHPPTHSHTHPPSLSHTHPPTLTHPPSLSHTHRPTHSYTLTHPLSLSPTQSHTHTHTPTHSHSQTHLYICTTQLPLCYYDGEGMRQPCRERALGYKQTCFYMHRLLKRSLLQSNIPRKFHVENRIPLKISTSQLTVSIIQETVYFHN
jgi:hypothetical protein